MEWSSLGCMRQALGPGALGRPRGSGWRGRWEGGSGWGSHVNPWLFHFNVWQNSLQIIKKKKDKSREHAKKEWRLQTEFSLGDCPRANGITQECYRKIKIHSSTAGAWLLKLHWSSISYCEFLEGRDWVLFKSLSLSQGFWLPSIGTMDWSQL